MKRKPLTKAESPNILVHVVASYVAFQAVLGFLCRHMLQRVLEVHARVDALAAESGMIQGYMENLVIRHTLVIKCIIFCRNHIYAHALNKCFYGTFSKVPYLYTMFVSVNNFNMITFTIILYVFCCCR